MFLLSSLSRIHTLISHPQYLFNRIMFCDVLLAERLLVIVFLYHRKAILKEIKFFLSLRFLFYLQSFQRIISPFPISHHIMSHYVTLSLLSVFSSHRTRSRWRVCVPPTISYTVKCSLSVYKLADCKKAEQL